MQYVSKNIFNVLCVLTYGEGHFYYVYMLTEFMEKAGEDRQSKTTNGSDVCYNFNNSHICPYMVGCKRQVQEREKVVKIRIRQK